MPHIYFAYARNDVELLREIIRASKGERFLSGQSYYDAEAVNALDTAAVENWKLRIDNALASCLWIFAICSPGAQSSFELRHELQSAKRHGKPIYPIWVKGERQKSTPEELLNSPFTDARGVARLALSAIEDLRAAIVKSQPRISLGAQSAPRLYELPDELRDEACTTFALPRRPEFSNAPLINVKLFRYDSFGEILDAIHATALCQLFKADSYGIDWCLSSNERLILPAEWALRPTQAIGHNEEWWLRRKPAEVLPLRIRQFDVVDLRTLDLSKSIGVVATGPSVFGVLRRGAGAVAKAPRLKQLDPVSLTQCSAPPYEQWCCSLDQLLKSAENFEVGQIRPLSAYLVGDGNEFDRVATSDLIAATGSEALRVDARVSIEGSLAPNDGDLLNTENPSSSGKGSGEEVWDLARLPPLTTFDGWLKQINPADLSELERFAINFAFPVFLGSHKNVRVVVSPEAESREYCRRRFSGDTHQLFPRSRYYSVCQDDVGEDNATLAAELNAYALSELTGLCVARRSENDASRIEVVFRGLPGQPNPLHLALTKDDVSDRIIQGNPLAKSAFEGRARFCDLVSDAEEFVLSMPCRVEPVVIPNVLDLRLPEARDWLMRFYAEPLDDFYGLCLKLLVASTPNPPFNLSDIRTDHWGMVAEMIGDHSFGGNALTELLACYLRSLNVNGLVYPSARNDYVSALSNGVLTFFNGWNYVDYRGASRPEKTRPLATVIEAYDGVAEIIDERVGEHAGSVQLTGNLLRNRTHREERYLIYVLGFGREARAANNGEIWVRGFHWFRRRVSLLTSVFAASCDKCGFETHDKAQAVASVSCPRCGYYGDL